MKKESVGTLYAAENLILILSPSLPVEKNSHNWFYSQASSKTKPNIITAIKPRTKTALSLLCMSAKNVTKIIQKKYDRISSVKMLAIAEAIVVHQQA